jgi:hypothetical protein
VVNYTFPRVPDEYLEQVQELRDNITDTALDLEDILDFNAFAFGFVCDRAT